MGFRSSDRVMNAAHQELTGGNETSCDGFLPGLSGVTAGGLRESGVKRRSREVLRRNAEQRGDYPTQRQVSGSGMKRTQRKQIKMIGRVVAI